MKFEAINIPDLDQMPAGDKVEVWRAYHAAQIAKLTHEESKKHGPEAGASFVANVLANLIVYWVDNGLDPDAATNEAELWIVYVKRDIREMESSRLGGAELH